MVGGGIGAAGAGAAIGGGAIGAGALVVTAFFFATWRRVWRRSTLFFFLAWCPAKRFGAAGATYGSSGGGIGAAIGGGAGAAIGGGGASFAHAASKTTIDPSINGRKNLTTVLSLAERHHT